MAGLQARRIALGRASLQWPTVEGAVLDVRFDEKTYRAEDGGETTAYSAHLQYQYFVKGKRHLSRRFTYRPVRGLGQLEAYTLLQGLYRGRSVTVHYDPQRPDRAVVLPGTDDGNLWRLRGWIAATAVSLIWAF
jgi:Protein of unknown function (DUF3592)